MGLLSKIFNQTPIQFTEWALPTSNAAGEYITNENSLNLSIVYACINVKANAVAKLPLQVFQKTDTGRLRRADHQVAQLLETRPNPHMTPFQFKHTVTTHRNLYGVAYVHQVINKRTGFVERLNILNPLEITVAQDASGVIFYVETVAGSKEPNVYNEDEMIRLPYLTHDGFTPKSPITVARETIGVLKKQQKFLGSFYSNGTLTRGILKIPTQLNKDAKDKVRAAWMEANSGENNASKIAVLDSGITFENITIPLQDAEFIASQKFGIEEIARIFNVPLHMVNSLDRATFSNIEQMSMDFVQNTIAPEVIAWEEELAYKMFTPTEQKAGMYVKFNMTSALRADSVARANYYKAMLESGAMSINEVRELEEKDAIANGDKHLVSLNFTTLDNLENYQAAKTGQTG